VNANLASILYLVCGVLFILALRGLSSPETSRRGNRFGMIGMAIAVLTTVATLWSQDALDPIWSSASVSAVRWGPWPPSASP
jgi:NAD(P) transhydrogenase subunit beta